MKIADIIKRIKKDPLKVVISEDRVQTIYYEKEQDAFYSRVGKSEQMLTPDTLQACIAIASGRCYFVPGAMEVVEL